MFPSLSASTTDSGSAYSGGSTFNIGGGINSPAIGAKTSWVPLALAGVGLVVALVLMRKIFARS